MKRSKRKTAEISTEVVEESKQVLLLPNDRVELNYVADDVLLAWMVLVSSACLILAQNSPAPIRSPSPAPTKFVVTVTRLSAQCLPTINLFIVDFVAIKKHKQNTEVQAESTKNTAYLTLSTTPSTRRRIYLLRCLQQPWQLYFRQSYQTTKPSSALLNPTRMGKRSDRKRRKLPRNQSSR